jgi:glycosyltransferase involved in cell wall biosynthesis
MGPRRRVLFACSTLAVGGAERQWSLLIPALSRQFEVSVLTLVTEGHFFDDLRTRGIPVSCAHMRRRTDVGGMRRALRKAEFQPHLVVSMSIDAHIIGHLIARRVGVPHMTNEHAGPGAPTRAHRKALTRLVGPRVDGVIAISKAQIPRLVKLGYRPDRITVIHNGVPTPSPTELASSVRARLGVQPDEFLALLVATLRPEKAADIFLGAVRTAHSADPRVRGFIVGGGPETERLKKLAGGDRVVQVLGERLDVPDILGAADVSCLSSTAEGMPMSLLEAMALAKPVVATDVGGVAEAVEAEKTGILVPAGDQEAFAGALLRLATNPTLAQQLGKAGRRRHRDLFGLDRMVADYTRAFEQVLVMADSRHDFQSIPNNRAAAGQVDAQKETTESEGSFSPFDGT